MAELAPQPTVQVVGKSMSLIPVGLKEAALDSPTFRATAVHFSDQVEIIERWLDAYVKSVSKLVHDVTSLEEAFNAFLARSVPPANISEAVLDHDYTLLAMKRFGECSREWWSQALFGMMRMDSNIVEPVKSFMSGELRNFKDARRFLEQSQKTFDTTLARYVGQSKTKEPSSLREDAFQVHETRKAYLKASLDFCLLAPQLRYTIDKLLVRVTSDQWKDMRRSREATGVSFAKWGNDMDRVRGWSKEMESGEGVFRRELQLARREIAEVASASSRPSRELEDYNLSTVAFLGSKGPSTVNIQSQGKEGERSEKQDWLFLRTISGKPARATWVRRWFYVKNGIFGWLVQGSQSGGVEESEKIGVLLCNVRPAVQEERRFCFEVKTKNQTILLQAETQGQLMEWLEAFEVAKNKALQASADNFPGGVDPAFAITPASIPEFAAKTSDGHASHGSEEMPSSGFERIGALPLPGIDMGNLASRSSFDISGPRRSVTTREEGESSRDHAARIMQKLDLHRKPAPVTNDSPSAPSPGPAGGIASLISASHNILPVYTPVIPQVPTVPTLALPQPMESHTSTLAPTTLANPPAPTNLSKSAVIVSGERGISIGGSDATGGMPSGMMANLWGSSNWGYINRLELGEIKSASPNKSIPPSPNIRPLEPMPKAGGDAIGKPDSGPSSAVRSNSTLADPSSTPATTSFAHRKTVSVDAPSAIRSDAFSPQPEIFPGNYPLELKTQEAQFRTLFPNVPREDKLLLVFRATWNPNEQQEFPGRVYVTQHDFYFYSHHLGLVLITGASMANILEVTAAPGKDCDFIFLHLKETGRTGLTRVTIKTFLEPLRLLQSRLNYLVDTAQSEEPLNLEETMAVLIKMENADPTRSPSMESWEDVSVNTPVDNGTVSGRTRHDRDLRTAIHVERGLRLGRASKDVTKFQLPSKPVVYEPAGMQRKVVERQFDISPKALFHVMFGDKSAVFQLLYHERRAQRIAQGPWVPQEGISMRRDFEFQIDYSDVFHRARQANVVDYQVIDIMNDHVCYVVTDMKTPWHLPHHKDFMLVSKIVITHVAKSKCKLAVYTKVDWSKAPTFSKGLVERQALDDSSLDALDLADVITDQVRKLGPQSRTKKAIHIFGYVGQQTSISMFSATESANSKRPQIKQRTLTHMLFETMGSFGESAISSLMMWTFAVLRQIWKIWSAHSIILIVLVLSVMTNAFFTSRDTSEWWSERNAAKFMSRIGVGPNPMMSKALYLKDLDDALTSLPTDLLEQPESKWSVRSPHRVKDLLTSTSHDQFREIANITDLDSPYQMAGTLHSETVTSSTARRLRRTRQHLGSYRHDLVVAMRVVNNIEREMMQAEWENWLLDENMKCKQVQTMLRENRTPTTPNKKPKGAESQQVLDAKERERSGKMDEMRKWHEEYCTSCKLEQDMLEKGRKHLSFG
ncbi:putative PH domain-containing protein [Lachnellula hyalina]|uniref:Putative PH domain-containing protein n=1 Tax=Lachnellula hyalina TaxID=1316788 RepID=A0A8H8QW14_9HELO|nr:putative PH domain-containing protein [Lachnellula hyalina]TVY23566.1 putative PH domain-containing protein [Lachnellula hyalina]